MPWWGTYLPLVLQLLGGVVLTQIAKGAIAEGGRRLSDTYTAALAVVMTTLLSFVVHVTAGVGLPLAFSRALELGAAAPLLWIVMKWAMLSWAPTLAVMVGECRRRGDRDGEAWTQHERAAKLRDPLFDTGTKFRIGRRRKRDRPAA